MSGVRVHRGDKTERTRDDGLIQWDKGEMEVLWLGYSMSGRGESVGTWSTEGRHWHLDLRGKHTHTLSVVHKWEFTVCYMISLDMLNFTNNTNHKQNNISCIKFNEEDVGSQKKRHWVYYMLVSGWRLKEGVGSGGSNGKDDRRDTRCAAV